MSETMTQTSTVQKMQAWLQDVEAEVQASDYWQALTAEDTPSEKVLAMMCEVMLEIWSYQKDVNEAVFTAVGRHGTVIDEQGLIRSMIAVQNEEVGHGTMALMDYIALGGDEQFARTRRPSPPAQAIIGTVRVLGETRTSFVPSRLHVFL